MPSCCAVNCHNSNANGNKLFRIPSGKNDQERRKIWLGKIKRENFDSITHAYLCEAHFEPDQFERKISGKLKPNAIPSIFSHLPPPKHRKLPKKRQQDDSNFSELNNQPTKLARSNYHSYSSQNLIYATEASGQDMLTPLIEEQYPEAPVFTSPNPELVSILKANLEETKRKLRQVEKQKEILEKKYAALFNYDQIAFMESLAVQPKVIWSDDTVRKALQLRFSCGFSGYSMLLSQRFPLPSDRTLRRRLENISFNNGVIPEVMDMLKLKVKSMSEQERKVSLILDEMAIQPSLDYDPRSCSVLGLPTMLNGNDQNRDTLASHALVFMLRGISTPWKQAVAYEFTDSSFSSTQTKVLIQDIIQQSHDIGLDVKSVTMDMGGGNQGILRDFGISCNRTGLIRNSCSHPVSPDEKLYFFPDVPHLIKNIRNHLTRDQQIYLAQPIVKKYNLPTNTVCLTFVEHLLAIDENHHLKLVPGLSYNHLSPGHFEKMKVNLATSLLSRATAAGLRICVERKLISKDALTTACFFEQVSMWYDLMTSRSTVMAFSHFSIKKHQNAVKFLQDFMEITRGMHVGNINAPWKPIQRGILISTQSALCMQNLLLTKESFHFVLFSAFTQDSLESLFSTVRFKNPVPTALEFKNSLRIISLSQLLKSKERGSYEADDCVHFPSPSDTFKPSKDEGNTFCRIEKNQQHLSPLEEMSLYNLLGYCVKKFIKLNKNCQACIAFLTTLERPAVADLTVEKCYNVNSLTFASNSVFQLLKVAETVILDLGDSTLKTQSVIPRIIEEAVIRSANIVFPKCHKVTHHLLRRYCRVRLFSFLKEKKVILKKLTTLY